MQPAKNCSNNAAHYRPDIDGLRALAILAVLLYHAYPKTVRGGFGGVDLFFVLSGYLIGGILFREIASQTFSLARFYARRVRRLFPALIVVLLSASLLGSVLLLPGEFKQFGSHLAGGVFFVENLILLHEAGYFDAASQTKPLLHLWSLAIEEQFYLAFPGLLLVLTRAGRHPIAGLTLLFALSLGLGAVHFPATDRFFTLPFRAWELLAGTLLAGFQQQGFLFRPHRHRHLLSGLGFGLILLSLGLLRPKGELLNPWHLTLVFGTLLMLVAGPTAGCNRILLGQRWVVALGLISYPLYLWHWVLLAFLHLSLPEPSAWLRAGILLISLILAILTTRFVETPIRFGPRRTWHLPVVTIVLIALGGLGLVIYRADGFPSRFTDPRQQQFGLDQRPKGRSACTGLLKGLSFCETIGAEPPKMALIGDSHSLHLVEGLKQIGVPLIHYGRHSCPPFFDTGLGPGESGCPPGRLNPALESVIANPEVPIVVLAGRFGVYWHGNIPKEGRMPAGIDFPLLGTGTLDNRSRFEQAARSTLERLRAAGKTVYLLVDVPELGFDPRMCVHPLKSLRRDQSHCGIPRDQYLRRREDYVQLFKALSTDLPGISWIDPIEVFCDSDVCHALSNDSVYYQDDDHLSKAGSRRIAPLLKDALETKMP